MRFLSLLVCILFGFTAQAQNLAGTLFEEKVFDFICEMAEVKEKKVSVEELYKEDQVEKPKKKSVSKRIKSKK